MPLPRFALRPSATPTHDDPEGGQRWHYLTPDGQFPTDKAYLYRHQGDSELGNTWWGEVGTMIIPGEADRQKVERLIELQLVRQGYEIIETPTWHKEVDEEEETWLLEAMSGAGAGWTGKAYFYPGHASRRVKTKPHWCAEATIHPPGIDGFTLMDHGEYADLPTAQKAAVKLVQAFLLRCLAMVPK